MLCKDPRLVQVHPSLKVFPVVDSDKQRYSHLMSDLESWTSRCLMVTIHSTCQLE